MLIFSTKILIICEKAFNFAVKTIQKMLQKLLKILPPFTLTVIWVIAILYFTLVPRPLPPDTLRLFAHADKIVHAVMFGGLFACLWIDTMRRLRSVTIPRQVWFAVASTLFGGLIEILQGGMRMGRGADWLDFLSDFAGVVLAWFVCRIASQKF